MVAGLSRSGGAICPSVASRAGPKNDQARPPRNAEPSVAATRVVSPAAVSVHHRPARHSRNSACAPWITRAGAMRSHSTPANQPNTIELPNDRPKPMPEARSEPIFSCRYRMTA